MATKRDLVEAHAYSRRRLVTAFVSGAPGGREVEPVRPGRTILGGLALSVLLILGALIAGVFAPRIPEDWNRVGLIVSKDDGGLYVITEQSAHPDLRPVINVTSAKLILGDLAADPTPLPTSFIQDQGPGDDIGILGAPHDVPSATRLVQTGWTACTGSTSGVRVNVSTASATAAPDDGALVVRSAGHFYLIASAPAGDGAGGAINATRLRLPDDGAARDNLLLDLGLPASVEHVTVPPEWLALFPTGPDLTATSFAIPGKGERPSYVTPESGLGREVRVGDLVQLEDGSAVVLLREGPAELDPFARAVYQHLPGAAAPALRSASSVSVQRVGAPYAAQWPTAGLAALEGAACGQLTTAAGLLPAVRLIGEPSDQASADDLSVGSVSVRVDPGAGAFVLSGDWSAATGAPFLVDGKGRAYPLVGAAAAQLGYGSISPPVVPDGWIALFEAGVPLSPEAALCPPQSGQLQPGDGRSCL